MIGPVASIALVVIFSLITGWLIACDIITRWRHGTTQAEAERITAENEAIRLANGADASCADPPCSYEDNWSCRRHCPNCTDISPCLGHDQGWAWEMERRFAR